MTTMPTGVIRGLRLERFSKQLRHVLDRLKERGYQKYSIERLKLLYAELLAIVDLIDCTDEELGRRKLDNQDERRHPLLHTNKRDLSRAFRILSAIPAADKEGQNGGAIGLRNQEIVTDIRIARTFERHLVEVLKAIGQVVAFGDQPETPLRSDPSFEYFCEKQILSLFVYIAKAKPPSALLHSVTWTARVKAQVLSTVSFLIFNAQDGPSLYYLLSHNTINDLICSILPVTQWTDPALELMLPSYITLLESITLQLEAAPIGIFTFLQVNDRFPLFSVLVDIATHPNVDLLSRKSCLALINTILNIQDQSVRKALALATDEQRIICDFLCSRLLKRYYQMAHLTEGLVVDHVRCNMLQTQMLDLRYQLNDISRMLTCGLETLNVRFCEYFLHTIVSSLLCNLVPLPGCRFLPVGILDVDVIPKPSALAQVSVVFLSNFWSLPFVPLQKMLCVALLHPTSSRQWTTLKSTPDDVNYSLTQALNSIVQENQSNSQTKVENFIDNPYRRELLLLLAGSRGEWRFIPASLMFEGMLNSQACGIDLLLSFQLIPRFERRYSTYPDSPMEESLASFLTRIFHEKTALSAPALERACALSLDILRHLVASTGKSNCSIRYTTQNLQSPLLKALALVHSRFCIKAEEARRKIGVSELFIDLTQTAIRNRYSQLSNDTSMGKEYGCVLKKRKNENIKSDILVRKFRTIGSNEVEDARFAIELVLRFRAVCKVMEEVISFEESAVDEIEFPTTEWGDNLVLTIADLHKKPQIGADLDLRGRITFSFSAVPSDSDRHEQNDQVVNISGNRKRTLSDEVVMRSSSQFFIVLDPSDLFIVKPYNKMRLERGTIICGISFRSVIAFADDEEWLHIAVRNNPDIGFLVKNGNMALRFDSVGACLIVREYLEKAQKCLRCDLKRKIRDLFNERFDSSIPQQLSPRDNTELIPSSSFDSFVQDTVESFSFDD